MAIVTFMIMVIKAIMSVCTCVHIDLFTNELTDWKTER